jgi:hypothetical protein
MLRLIIGAGIGILLLGTFIFIFKNEGNLEKPKRYFSKNGKTLKPLK